MSIGWSCAISSRMAWKGRFSRTAFCSKARGLLCACSPNAGPKCGGLRFSKAVRDGPHAECDRVDCRWRKRMDAALIAELPPFIRMLAWQLWTLEWSLRCVLSCVEAGGNDPTVREAIARFYSVGPGETLPVNALT